MQSIFNSKGKEKMTGNQVLDALAEVFPEVNLSTLIEVSISFKDDIDAAADFVAHYVVPGMISDDNTANTIGDSHSHVHQQVPEDNHIVHEPIDPSSSSQSLPSEVENIHLAENEDSSMGELMQSPAASSTFGQACLYEENNSGHFLADAENLLVDDEVIYLGKQQNPMQFSDQVIGGHCDSQLHQTSSENMPGISAEDDLSLHENLSPDMTIRSTYSVGIESLDNTIADENCSKNTLLSNVVAINEMLEEVELNEAKTKLAVSEASHAGTDILVVVEKLKEISTLAAEENSKVAGEVSAEKSILASEAQGLEARLFHISEERNNFVLIIDEMHHTLQRRLAASKAEREAAETGKIDKETMAQEMLNEQEILLDATKEERKKLENQVQENAKLRELLMDRGHAVDALHGEMLGIFESITQLQNRVDARLPSDESFFCGEKMQRASSSLSSSSKQADPEPPVDEPRKLASSSFSNLPVDEPVQLTSSSFSSSVKSEAQKLSAGEPLQPDSFDSLLCEALQQDSSSLYSSVISASSEGNCSAYQSHSNLNVGEMIANASSHDYFALDDSWDVVEDEATKPYLC